MAKVRGFKAIRPNKELADKIAALPYDVMNTDEAREAVKNNKYSFLHVDKAEVDLDPSIDIHDKKVYEKARDNLNGMIERGEFIQDECECLYIYRQVMNGRSQTGLVFCAAIDDYINNVIKKHEFTRADKEEDRTKHVDYCDANTGPIFLTYKYNKYLNEIVKAYIKKQWEYDFISEDGIRHTVWVIRHPNVIKVMKDLFGEIKNFYIADGHHRTASAVKVGMMRRKENPNYTGEEEFNFFLAVAFPDNELKIMDYNRVVKDLNGYTKKEFIEKLKEKFYIEEAEGDKKINGFSPSRRNTFGMNIDGEWYYLIAKEGSFDEMHPIKRLDVSILQDNILEPILGIEDVRTSDRIDFIGGIRGISELNRRVNKDMKLAFSMYPPDIQDVMAVANIGEVMPPKSTWFEPKLRSGLFIHKLK